MKIGEKIKRLRTQHKLTQEELADRSELTKGFISQVERELTSPSIATLVDILEALGTNLQDFFNDEVPEKVVFTKNDVAIKNDPELKSEIHWLVPNAQKNAMEPILVHIEPEGQTPLTIPMMEKSSATCSRSDFPALRRQEGSGPRENRFIILRKQVTISLTLAKGLLVSCGFQPHLVFRFVCGRGNCHVRHPC